MQISQQIELDIEVSAGFSSNLLLYKHWWKVFLLTVSKPLCITHSYDRLTQIMTPLESFPEDIY